MAQHVSDGFLAAWRNGGRRVKRVYLSTARGPWTGVDFVDYRIAGSRGARTVSRYSGTITLPPTVDPSTVDEFASRVQVRAGFVVNGVEELVNLATMTVYDVDEDNVGRLILTGYSVEKAVEDAKFRSAWVLTSGSGVTALCALLAPANVEIVVRTTRNSSVSPAVYDSDRWGAAVNDLITAMSVDVFCDPNGVLVIEDVPTLDDAPVVTLVGVTTGYARHRTRQGVPNVVVVEGNQTSQGPPPRGEWVDRNPFSPTYIGGPYGQVVQRFGNPLMLTPQSCTLAATTIGTNLQGLSRSMTLTSLSADFLEPGDVVDAVLADGSHELHIVDQLTHASSGTQSLTTRTTGGVSA